MHYIDLLMMPTMCPITWESPKNLLKGAIKCLVNMSFHNNVYMLGHLAVHLSSPLLENGEKLVAMSLVNPKDRPDGVFKRHLGFGVLGEPIQGCLEDPQKLLHKLNVYTKRKKLAFMRFKINKTGMRRILSFLNYFTSKIKGTDYAPCDFYSGVMNPIYEYEGAGCTSFGITLLKQAGVTLDSFSEWKIEYNIPMNLVGGKFNNNYRIKASDVLHSNQWYPTDESVRNIKYIESEMYDPSIMYDWVNNIHQQNLSVENSKLVSFNENIKGLEFDFSDIIVDNPDQPLLKHRKKDNFFVNQYMEKILKI